MTEDELHKSVADLLDWVLLPPAVWTTFPAGWGKLSKSMAGRLRGAGLKAGFPDILVFFDGRCTGLELKVSTGRISAEQKDMFLRLETAGVQVYICRSTEDIIKALGQAGIPIRSVRISA